MTEKLFAKGIFYKRRESAPDFVIGNLSVKKDDFVEFVNEHAGSDGWLNLNILKSQSGKPYIEVDTWQPIQSRPVEAEAKTEGDLPF